MLKPKLITTTMDMPTVWKISPDLISHFHVKVELWEEVGLCIHPELSLIGKSAVQSLEKWSVSHYQSGWFIFQGLKTRDESIRLMMELRKYVMPDWRLTVEQIRARDDFQKIQQSVLNMRESNNVGKKELINVKNFQTGKRKTGYKRIHRM